MQKITERNAVSCEMLLYIVEVKTKQQIRQILFTEIFSPQRFSHLKGTFLAVWGLAPHKKTPHTSKKVPMVCGKFLSREIISLEKITDSPFCLTSTIYITFLRISYSITVDLK